MSEKLIALPRPLESSGFSTPLLTLNLGFRSNEDLNNQVQKKCRCEKIFVNWRPNNYYITQNFSRCRYILRKVTWSNSYVPCTIFQGTSQSGQNWKIAVLERLHVLGVALHSGIFILHKC